MDLRRLGLLAWLSLAACANRPEKTDVSLVMKAVSEYFVMTEATSSEQVAPPARAFARARADSMRAPPTAEGAGESASRVLPSIDSVASLTCGTQTVAALDATGLTCTETCPSTTSYKADCAVTSEKKFGCSTLSYGFSGGSLVYLVDFTDTSASLRTISMSGRVRGWQLDGTLACQMKYAMLPNATTGVTEFKLSCDSFSCSYDGKALDCADFQNVLNMTTSSCYSTGS